MNLGNFEDGFIQTISKTGDGVFFNPFSTCSGAWVKWFVS
jgi:hypothetical protein